MKVNRFALFTGFVLAVNLLVIMWGAYVRATGSGAGCGSHWPSCNGEIIPQSPQTATVIEFTHRLSSGLAFVLVAVLLVWAWRRFPKGSPTRSVALLSMIFIISEALVGAALVLFKWVAGDTSTARVIVMALHLLNTLLLLGALTLVLWHSSGGRRLRFNTHNVAFWTLLAAVIAVSILAVSGAITALGDTLFPVASLREGIQQDFASTANFMVRLRVFHPILAILTGTFIFVLSLLMGMFYPQRWVRRFAGTLIGLFLLQLTAGLINLGLRAPVWMQLVHLLLADLVWIFLVFLSASVLSQPGVGETGETMELKDHAYTQRVDERG
jgi:heme A synthase